MKKIIILMVIGLVLSLSLSSVAQAADYIETLIGNELVNGGTAMGWQADDRSWLYTLPFAFPFYGMEYTQVYICSNGFIDFTSSATTYNNSTTALKSRVMIAPLWDDFRTDSFESDIYIHQPSTDSLCIRWQAVEYNGGERANFEVVLYANGVIKFNYGTTSNTLTPTIGISKGDNTNFLLSAYDSQSSLNNAQTSFIGDEVPNRIPTAAISAAPMSGKLPLKVEFTGAGTDSDGIIVSYHWEFGDTNTSNQQNPSYTYNNPGNYTVTLTVTDDDGAIGSAELVITVEPSLPRVMRFQAVLADALGKSLDGTFKLTFRLYDTITGGVSIWQEVQTGVIVEDSILDVELGSVTPLELPFDRQYWLGVEVASDGEMSPRFKLTTVPYSFKSVQ